MYLAAGCEAFNRSSSSAMACDPYSYNEQQHRYRDEDVERH
jgi:hypothetical protein